MQWHHFVARGIQSGNPSSSEAWYDIVAGPFDAAAKPLALAGLSSNPRLSLNHGMVYLRGRWVIPTTRRLRGTSGGGQLLMPDGTTVGPMAVACLNVDQVVKGTLVVSSDDDRDIVFFPAGQGEEADPSPPVQVVLRGWKPECNSPDASANCEVTTCEEIKAGYYYVISTDRANRKQRIEPYPWNYTELSGKPHEPYVVEVFNTITAKVRSVQYNTLREMPPLK
jgi:hypothetical protein